MHLLFDTYPIAPPAVPAASGSLFLYQQPSYLSIVDGVAGWGHNTGAGFRPATGGAPNWYYIVSTASTETYYNSGGSSLGSTPTTVSTRTYHCSLPAALAHDVNNKVIVNLTSGLFDFSSLGGLVVRGSNVSVIGFTCRYGTGYGAAIKMNGPFYIIGSHVYFSGWRIFVQTTGATPAGDQRDGVTSGGFGPQSSHVVVDRCEVYGSIDESFDFFNCGVCSLVRSAVCSPNSNSGLHATGHNYAIIFAYGPGTVASLQRVAIFHAAARFPLGYSENVFGGNILAYNISDGLGNNSQVFQFDRHTGDSTSAASHKAVLAHSQYANGPQGYANNWIITANNQQSGTQIYATGLRAKGFSQITNASPISFFGTEPNHDARQWRVTTIPSGVVPDGCGANLEYVDALTDDLMLSTYLRTECGQQPKFPADTKLSALFTQYENYANGTGSGYGSVATGPPSDPVLTTFTIDRTNGTHVTNYHGGISIPDYTTRDNIGSNGRSLGEEAIRLIGALSIGP